MAKKGEINPKRLPSGHAKVEFIRNRDEICSLLAAGHSMLEVHRRLTEKGRITMSPSSFKNLCRPDTVRARNERRRKQT